MKSFKNILFLRLFQKYGLAAPQNQFTQLLNLNSAKVKSNVSISLWIFTKCQNLKPIFFSFYLSVLVLSPIIKELQLYVFVKVLNNRFLAIKMSNIPCTIYLTYIHSRGYRVNIPRVLRRGYRGKYTMHHLPNIYTQQGIQSQYTQSAKERVQG